MLKGIIAKIRLGEGEGGRHVLEGVHPPNKRIAATIIPHFVRWLEVQSPDQQYRVRYALRGDVGDVVRIELLESEEER